jgi:hypothetical protein
LVVKKEKTIEEKIREIFLYIFPTPKNFSNFLWGIILILCAVGATDKLISLISIIGAIYCFNKWWER